MTNGEKMQEIFPDADFDFKGDIVGIVFKRKYRYPIYDVTISMGWWNALYDKGKPYKEDD